MLNHHTVNHFENDTRGAAAATVLYALPHGTDWSDVVVPFRHVLGARLYNVSFALTDRGAASDASIAFRVPPAIAHRDTPETASTEHLRTLTKRMRVASKGAYDERYVAHAVKRMKLTIDWHHTSYAATVATLACAFLAAGSVRPAKQRARWSTAPYSLMSAAECVWELERLHGDEPGSFAEWFLKLITEMEGHASPAVLTMLFAVHAQVIVVDQTGGLDPNARKRFETITSVPGKVKPADYWDDLHMVDGWIPDHVSELLKELCEGEKLLATEPRQNTLPVLSPPINRMAAALALANAGHFAKVFLYGEEWTIGQNMEDMFDAAYKEASNDADKAFITYARSFAGD